MEADLILKNASVITMDARQPSARLVAIKGNRIALVDTGEGLGQISSPGVKIVDCQGKAVVPGFIDAHLHLFSLIRQLLSVDLSQARSIAEIQVAIRERAQRTPVGKWVMGANFNEFNLAEKRYPDRHDIDKVVPDRPVVLVHRSLHACVLNSLALSLAGITIETPEPEGAVFERELPTGEPNGILFGMMGTISEKIMPSLSEDELDEGVRLVNRYNLSYGITSIQDASIANDYERWQELKRFKESGKLASRVSLMFGTDNLDRFREAGLRQGSGTEHLRLGALKLMLTEAPGRLLPGQPELNEQVLTAHQAGMQVAIHAVSENEVQSAIIALENIKSPSAVAVRRHRIEHGSECPDYLLSRLSKLGALVVTQPPFLYFNGERYLATLPPETQKVLYRVRSWLNCGLTVAGSSDSPVVPASPLVGVYAAITRRAASGQVVLPEEAIPVHQALALYTSNAAYTSFEEGLKGSITPGKLADLVVLSDDPLKCPPEQIKDIKVEMTILDGRIVWED